MKALSFILPLLFAIICIPVTAQDINADKEMTAAIDSALVACDLELLKELIEPGTVRFNTPRQAWNRCLLAAAELADGEAFKLLYDYNQFKEVTDWEKLLVTAIKGGQPDIIAICLKKGKISLHNEVVAAAASANDLEMVVSLLGYGAAADIPDANGMTPLMYAAGHGNVEMIYLLIYKGARVNPIKHFALERAGDYPPLYYAARNGHAGAVRVLLDNNADPLSKHEPKRDTPLDIAAAKGYARIVEMMENHDPRAYGYNRGGALGIAIRNGHSDAVRLIMENNPKSPYTDDTHPLLIAASYGDTVMISLVMENIPHMRSVGDFRVYPAIQKASDAGHLDAMKFLIGKSNGIKDPTTYFRNSLNRGGHTEIIRYWVDYGADIDDKDGRTGRSPLMDAVLAGKKEAVRTLLELGADYRATDYRGATALMYAAAYCDPEVMDMMLGKGGPVEGTDYKGDSALAYAAYEGVPENVEYLLSNGFLVGERDKLGRTLLMKAVMYEFNEMYDPYEHPEMRRRSRAKVELLLSRGADVNARDKEGMTALMYAVMNAYNDSVEYLLSHGASTDNVNIYGDSAASFYDRYLDLLHSEEEGELARILGIQDPENHTSPRRNNQYSRDRALLEAVYKCDIDSVSIALEEGADINTTYDHEGASPLTWALESGCSLEMLRLLVDNGAWVDSSNFNRTTSLMRAVMAGNYELAEYFISMGADVNRKNEYGNTALVFAAKNGDIPMIDLLAGSGADLMARAGNGYSPVKVALSYGHESAAAHMEGLGAEEEPRSEWNQWQ